MQKSLRELADLIGGDLTGSPDVQILGAADISDAEEGDIVFAETAGFLEKAIHSRASAIITRPGAKDSDKAILVVQDPRFAFAQVLRIFSPVRERQVGIHPSSIISPDAAFGGNPSIGANTFIG